MPIQVYLCIEEQRLILLPNEEAINICSIKQGILFILAKWSGASQLAFLALSKALVSLPALDGLYLYVADTDSENTQTLLSELGYGPAGAGETYWLLEGQIQHKVWATLSSRCRYFKTTPSTSYRRVAGYLEAAHQFLQNMLGGQ